MAATLTGYSDEDVFARLQRIREGAIVEAGGSPKLSEFDVFASGRPEIGQNSPSAKLYAQIGLTYTGDLILIQLCGSAVGPLR